jgi:hypothetical protein
VKTSAGVRLQNNYRITAWFWSKFTVTGGFLNATISGFLKGFTTLLSCFPEASKNFVFDFLNNKDTENVKTTWAHSESTDIKAFKQIFSYASYDPVPLNTHPILKDAPSRKGPSSLH